MNGVELSNVKKSYGSVTVIDDLDLTLAKGEFVVFVGPSGSGKSTLLRMIAGLEEITDGDLVLEGTHANGLTPTERGVSMVFQNYALYPHMTVRGNIGFGLRMGGMPKRERALKVEAAAELLQLTEYLDRKPSALSGGQRQRVAIGRAIVRNPRLFLFDEPLSNLDAALRQDMRVQIAKLHRSLDTTMIYVTHDQVEAMTLADTIVVLRDGRIEQIGNPLDLFDDPDNLFVAEFLGNPKINVLQGTVQESNGEKTVLLRDGSSIACPATLGVSEGDQINVAVRPRHLEKGDAGDVRFTFVPDIRERLGGQDIYFGVMSGGDKFAYETDDRQATALEQEFTVSASYGSLMFFSKDGKRLRYN